MQILDDICDSIYNFFSGETEDDKEEFVPEYLHDYVTSARYEKNRTTSKTFACIKNSKLFLSNKNIKKMARELYSDYIKYRKRYNPDKTGYGVAKIKQKKVMKFPEFLDLIKRLMVTWARKNKIDQMTTDPVVNSFVEVLDYTNREFKKDHLEYLGLEPIGSGANDNYDVDLFRAGQYTGELNEFTNSMSYKKYDEMTPDDIRNLDVWRQDERFRSNKNFRYKNWIPAWQTSMSKRHYDKDNDGLRATVKTASRGNLVRGYDMHPIYATTGKYNADDWYGV